MNQAITINNVLGWDNTNFNYLNDCINQSSEVYKVIYNNDPNYNAFIDKYKLFIQNKLKLSLKAIGNFESLYDLDTSQAMVLKLTNDKIQELYNKSINSKLMLDNTWDDFLNIGSIESNTNTSIGYSGYDINNQASNFQTNKGNSKSSGGSTRLQYIQYLNETINNFVEIFVKDMIKYMCRIIY